MKKTITKIPSAVLTIFFVANLAFGQSIKTGDKEIKLFPDTERKVSMLFDNLIGTWELIKTVRIESVDTIIQEPSTQLWLSPAAKPLTTIKINSFRGFEIEQACMKCPYLFWKGQLEIETRTIKGNDFFYLNFIDNRLIRMKSKKRKKAFTLEFNGHITSFESGEMVITDNDGREWIYKRIEN